MSLPTQVRVSIISLVNLAGSPGSAVQRSFVSTTIGHLTEGAHICSIKVALSSRRLFGLSNSDAAGNADHQFRFCANGRDEISSAAKDHQLIRLPHRIDELKPDA